MFDLNAFQFTSIMAAVQFAGFASVAFFLQRDARRALRTSEPTRLPVAEPTTIDAAPTLEEPRRAA
jgi:hypothetical protein